MARVLKNKMFKAVRKLPDKYMVGVGRIVFKWSAVQSFLVGTMWLLMGVGQKVGRISAREPRDTQFIGIIQDLCDLRGIPEPQGLKNMANDIERLSNERNLVAHGVWLWDEKKTTPFLRQTKKSYQPQGWHKKVSANKYPEPVPRTSAQLRKIAKEMDALALRVLSMKEAVEASLAALQKKSQPPPQRKALPPPSNDDTPPPQPRSSPEK